MGRLVDVEHLVEATEIASRLGLSNRMSVNNFVLRYDDFPEPLGKWGQTRLWSWPDVEAWARATGRLS